MSLLQSFQGTRWMLRCWVTAVACLALGWQGADGAEPRRQLWDLVQKDVGLAIEVRGLSENSRKFIDSELFRRIKQHSAWQQVLGSGEVQHLREMQQTIGDVTKQPMVTWLDKLFGQEAILSLTPHAAGRPQSVLLTRLKSAEDLPEILAAWEKLEPRTETRLQHRSREYFRRAKSGDQDPLYYALVDEILVISDRAEALTPVLDLALDELHENAIQRTVSFQKTLQALNATAVVRVIVQPASWHPGQGAGDPKSRDPVERWVQQALQRCQAIGIGVRLESGVVAEVVAHSEELASNPRWLKLVEKTSGMPEFLARVPKSAVLAIAGRHDLGDIADWIMSGLSPEQSKKLKSIRQVVRGFLLGSDLFDDVLPRFPADFGGYVVPRADLQLTAAPVDGLIAVSLPVREAGNDAGSQKPTVRQAIENALTTGAALVISLHNANARKEASIEESDHNGVTVHWIENLGPLQPAYALAPDYFLAATSPQLIRDFLSQSPTDTWGADEGLKRLRESICADASQVATLQGRLLREFLTQHRGFLLKQLEAAHKLKPEDAGKRLDRMLEWVQLSDRVILASALHSDHVKLVLAITATESPSNDK